MHRRLPKILVTGAAGFIGSEFVRQAVKAGYRVVVIDKLTYAADLLRLRDIKGQFKFYYSDICNKAGLTKIFHKEEPEQVIHFAAESHVDRSIIKSTEFIQTNVYGTQILLDVCRVTRIDKFVAISTDEVYGDIKKGEFSETSPLNPSSPYSASKASADLLIKSYIRTFGFPAVIVRPSNNYGPWQYPEKFIPVAIYKAINNEKIPVYGKGINVREWLYVEDCANAILNILENAKLGEIYNIGSGNEKQNIEIAKEILGLLNRPLSLIEHVRDRPGHDLRYSLNFSKIKRELDWQPKINFREGLIQTINWYKDNLGWLETKVKSIAIKTKMFRNFS